MTCRMRIGQGEVTWYDEDGEVTMRIDSNNKVTTYKNKQEPVAWLTGTGELVKNTGEFFHWMVHWTPLYTHPQPKVTTSDMKQEHVDKTAKQRHEWVGLTEQEETGILLSSNTVYSAMKFTEAKLMEKNK